MNRPLLFLLLVCWGLVKETCAQSITLSVSNVPLDTVFARIQEQSPYRFVYTREELSGTKKISFSVQKAPIETVLSLSFKSQPVDYSMEDKYIYVRKREKAKMSGPDVNQNVDITGRVTDSIGNPLAGVSVTSTDKGNQVTTTDVTGSFFIKALNPNSSLTFSSIGYQTETRKIGGQLNLLVQLRVIATTLLDVVINKGYYSTSQRLNTGDVSIVKGEDIQKQPVSDPILAIQGRVSGLYVTQASGIPGANAAGTTQFRLRGQNSIRTDRPDANNPLFIIDGIPFNSNTLTNTSIGSGAVSNGLSPFNTINSSDIDNIEVLKDADATSIYGARGANGVILITTKKGRSGKTQIELNGFSGEGKVTRKITLLNTSQYLMMRHEAFSNDGAVPGNTDYDINGSWDTTRYTDWQKVFIGGTARYSKGNVAISGGNDLTQFIATGSFSNQTTVFPGDYADKIGSTHISLSNSSKNRKFQTTISASYSNDNNVIPPVDFTSKINLAPDAPALYNMDGSLNWQPNAGGINTFSNPLAALNQKDGSAVNSLIGNINFSYEIIPGLQIRTSIGYNKIEMNQNNISLIEAFSPGMANNPNLRSNNFANSSASTSIAEPQINYKTKFSKGLFEALLGTTFQGSMQKSFSELTSNYASDALVNNIAAASAIFGATYNYTQYRYNAIYGRVGYNWQGKYLMNVTARRDGSSRFGPGKQFGNFGSVGLGWILSKEDLFKKLLPVASYGKLRASYGITGNDNIADYQYLSTYSAYNYTYQGLTGLYPTNITNPYYHWEQVKKLEVGLEIGLFKDRILFGTSYYRDRTENQLVGYGLPAISGFTSITSNLPALIQNTGWEFELSTINVKAEKFIWRSSINLSISHNKLLAYPNIAGSSYANTYTVGQSLFSVKGYHYTGVDRQTGLYTFQDANKDGKITSPQDYVALKPKIQKFYGGFDNSFKYKAFQLDVFIQFVNQTGKTYFSAFLRPGTSSNEPVDVLSRWQKPGDIANVQKFSQNNSKVTTSYSFARSSDYPLQDASFGRVKNLSLSYGLPAIWSQKAEGTNVRIYLQCQNLFTITRYKGLDPENTGGFTLPPLRMITTGLQITF